MPAIDDAVARGRVRTVDGRLTLARRRSRPGLAAPPARSVRWAAAASSTRRRRRWPRRRRRRARHCAHPRRRSVTTRCRRRCQHFPRVCLIDDRGVRVSLSHYCPTAAAMLVDDDGPVTIVAGPPAVPGRAMPEGLDVRDGLPPRLTERVLTDLEGMTAWERHVVGTLAGADTRAHRRARRGPPRRRRAPGLGLAAAVGRGRWPTRWRRQPQVQRPPISTRAARRIGDASTWPAWFAIAADTCRGAWLADAPPPNLADLDARYVAARWAAHAAASAAATWRPRRSDRGSPTRPMPRSRSRHG